MPILCYLVSFSLLVYHGSESLVINLYLITQDYNRCIKLTCRLHLDNQDDFMHGCRYTICRYTISMHHYVVVAKRYNALSLPIKSACTDSELQELLLQDSFRFVSECGYMKPIALVKLCDVSNECTWTTSC